MELINSTTAFTWTEPLDINGIPMTGVPEKQGVSFGTAGYNIVKSNERGNNVSADDINRLVASTLRPLSKPVIEQARLDYTNRTVPDFPSYFIVEPTTACNRRCTFCSITATNRHGMMKWEVYDKLMKECAQHPVYGLSLYQLGEPMLWRDGDYTIADMISRGKRAGFKVINLSTNGDVDNLHLLNDDWSGDLIISIDGVTTETYAKNRPSAKKEDAQVVFDRTVKRVLDFLNNRPLSLSSDLRIRIQIINNESTRAEIVDFIRFWIKQRGVYDVFVKNLDSMRPWLKEQVVSEVDDAAKAAVVSEMPCQHLWSIGSVTVNSAYTGCCHDARTELTDGSNIKNTSFYDWWHGEYMNKLRQDHIDGKFPYPCSECRERDCWLG